MSRCSQLIERYQNEAKIQKVKSNKEGVAFSYNPEQKYLYVANGKTVQDVVIQQNKDGGYKLTVDTNGKEFDFKDARSVALSAASYIGMRDKAAVIEKEIKTYFKK